MLGGMTHTHSWINTRINVDVCECVGQYTCIYFLAVCIHQRDRNNDTLETFSTLVLWTLVSKYYFPKKGTQGSLENCLIPGLRQGKQEMNVEHIVPESKEVLEREKERECVCEQGRGHVRRTQSSQWPKEKQLKQQNK